MADDPYRFTGERVPGETWSARHQRMIEALPDGGGTVIVITGELGRHVKRGLRATRGFAFSRQWRFIAVRRLADCANIEGLRGEVVVDWSFAKHAAEPVQDRVRDLIAGVQAMRE